MVFNLLVSSAANTTATTAMIIRFLQNSYKIRTSSKEYCQQTSNTWYMANLMEFLKVVFQECDFFCKYVLAQICSPLTVLALSQTSLCQKSSSRFLSKLWIVRNSLNRAQIWIVAQPPRRLPVSCSLTEIAHLPPHNPPNLPCVMPQPVTFTGSKRWARLRRNCFKIWAGQHLPSP